MARVVSLGQARKARTQIKARALADANAVKFGRAGAQKARDRAKAEKAARDLDGKRRDPE